MIILNTNSELKATFERLLQTIGEPVEWNGRFVAVGDYLILHGRVRSLFFNFETKKVVTNLIDIPVKEEETIDVGERRKVQNVINLALYAFGKWGSIHGVKVEQDYAQLNEVFHNALREFFVEPAYSNENFRFYKNGIRLSYEDVIQLAIESAEQDVQKLKQEQEMEGGLWHKLVWKKGRASFQKNEMSFDERQKNRLGNNFYMVSYQCPKCKEHLHMIVFPEQREFRVETSEGGVYLARAYTCEECCRFYTPRPERLLAEGDVYQMDFEGDGRAYQDYLELLGRHGALVSNYKFNEYEMVRKRKEKMQLQEVNEPLEELCGNLGQLTDAKIAEMEAKTEEGFYPADSIRRFEPVVRAEAKKRAQGVLQTDSQGQPSSLEASGRTHMQTAKAPQPAVMSGSLAYKAGRQEKGPEAAQPALGRQTGLSAMEGQSGKTEGHATGNAEGYAEHAADKAEGYAEHAAGVKEIPMQRREAAKKRFTAKCNVLDRLSFDQVRELKSELLREKNLYDSEKEPFLKEIKQKEEERKREHIAKLADSCKGESYVKIGRILEEIQKTDLPEEEKERFLKPLREDKKKQGAAEVRELFAKLPANMDLKQYHAHMKRLEGYPDVDISPYEDYLEEKKQQAQGNEILKMIRHSRTADRQDLLDLTERLKNQNFDSAVLTPYLDKIEDKIREYDEKEIEEICGNPMQKSEAELMEAYAKIESGVFLPELKTSALEMLKKRLEKLKTDECELLVHKLEDSLDGRIRKNERHHFYPAKRILTKEAKPEEYKEIQYALDTYGAKRSMFEYPIFIADTSRDKSGKEGFILTPEHIFYRTLLNAYVVSINDIRRVSAQTGFFNSGVSLELLDGSKVKIPYAVDKKELIAWGNCLEEFIHYLQEKPDSRNLTYLAQEKHEKICCFRCGYSYKEGNVCPKCGYKMNQ